MRHASRALLAAGLGFAVSCLVACGGGNGLLAAGDSSSLNSSLDAVSNAVVAHNCGAAQSAANSFSQYVNGLPATVSPTLRTDLLDGVNTVAALAQRDCRRTTTTTPSTSTTKSTTTTTKSTTSTTTSSTTTTPSTSTTTTSTSTTTTTPATSTTTTGTTSTPSGGGGVGDTTTSGANGNGGN